VLEDIFRAFRAARQMENGKPLLVLQEQLAAHAPDLIQNNFIDLKTLISTLQSLEPARGDDDNGANTEQRLQQFLRGESAEPTPEAEGAIQ
jgi:hypothetical protein